MKKLLLITIIFVFLFATNSSAYNITGGTVEQQTLVMKTINASQFPEIAWVESQLGEINIEIGQGDSWSVHRHIHIEAPNAIYFTETVAHEWSHQVWFALPQAARDEWLELSTINYPNYDSSIWLQSPVENYAENLRISAWDSEYYVTKNARTDLYHFKSSFVRSWNENWTSLSPTTTTSTITTTTTVPYTNKFSDIPSDDIELLNATQWGQGIFRGYEDGKFGPYNPITHHQVAFVADRWKGFALTEFLSDWTFATREDILNEFPGFRWKEARWDETITRSQFLRLIYRAQ